jgi:hypothetical protein
MKKIILIIILVVIVVFIFVPIFPPLNQGCPNVYIKGQAPCTFHKETGYEYFFKRGGWELLMFNLKN